MKLSDIKPGETYKLYAKTVVVDAIGDGYGFSNRRMVVAHEPGNPDKKLRVSPRSLSPLDPSQVAPPDTSLNAGTCCWCARVMKLDGGKLVLHGYQRPGHGWIEGECPGVRTLPYEVSPDELPKVREIVRRHLVAKRELLKKLKSGEVVELMRLGYQNKVVIVKKAEKPEDFKRELDWQIYQTEAAIKSATGDIKRIDKWRADWKPGLPLLHKD